jgi:2,5-diketo-D-gluconate reductase A
LGGEALRRGQRALRNPACARQLANIVIPKSATPTRIRENFDVFGFTLTDDEVASLSTLDRGERTGPDPDAFNLA